MRAPILAALLLAGSASSFAPSARRPTTRTRPLSAKKSAAPLPLATVAELIEVTFVDACKGAATGTTDAFRLFAAAAKGGYEHGHAAEAVGAALADVATQSAGRPLAPEEESARAAFLGVVYLALEDLGRPAATTAAEGPGAPPPGAKEEYGRLVRDALAAHASGAPLSTVAAGGEAGGDPVAAAVRATCVKLVACTAKVVEEEDVASTPLVEAKPAIPGTGFLKR